MMLPITYMKLEEHLTTAVNAVSASLILEWTAASTRLNWTTSTKSGAITSQTCANRSFTANGCTDSSKLLETFWWWRESRSSFLYQRDHKSYCTRCSLWWCDNEGGFSFNSIEFEDLSNTASRFHLKMISILKTMAKFRYCVIMLDFKMDQKIIEMFQHFLRNASVHQLEITLSLSRQWWVLF